MKVILTQNVENLGSLGDTIDVKPGYGRNYLIPKGIALMATGKASKELRHRLQHLEKLREGEIALAKEQAEKLKAIKLEVTRKAGPGGRLFGSVTNRDLNLLLKENKFELNRRAILLNSPIRNTGTHEFFVRIHSEVTIPMQVQVKVEIDDLQIKKEPEVPKKEQDGSNKHADQKKSVQESETLQKEQVNIEKDLDKNENEVGQNNAEK